VKYSQNKTYVVELCSGVSFEKILKQIENVSSVLWVDENCPTDIVTIKTGAFLFYNGSGEKTLTFSGLDCYSTFYNEKETVELNENEFVEMLSMLAPKR
jgi:hypothetical protein